jgi:hypothetical protein
VPYIAPVLTLEDAQFVIDLLNGVPLPGVQAKLQAAQVMQAFGAAEPYEPEPEEPPTPPEEFSTATPDVVE